MAAKKKAAKKAMKAKAPAKKAAKRSTRKATPKAKPAGSVEVVKLPVVDVTAQVKEDVIAAKNPQSNPQPAPSVVPVEKHEEFQKALTQEQPQRGFWARLFGKK